jgi:signal transduction histidine kinase
MLPHYSAVTLVLVKSLRLSLRALDPFRADVLLAALFVAATVLELALIDNEGRDRALTIVAGALAVSAIAFRRRDPLLAGVIFSVPGVIQGLLGGYFTTNSTVPFVVVILLFYSAGRYAAGRRFWLAFAVTLVGTMATLGLESGSLTADDALWGGLLFGLPAVAGRALRSRTLLQGELREKAQDVEAKRVERARSAIEEERARIASELQAIVANGVSAMVVQAETVPRALAVGNGARAGAALAAVEETGRDALTEMRRLLGVLRRDGEGPELAPQPGLGRLDMLRGARARAGTRRGRARGGRRAAARTGRRPHRVPRARGRAGRRRREGGLRGVAHRPLRRPRAGAGGARRPHWRSVGAAARAA